MFSVAICVDRASCCAAVRHGASTSHAMVAKKSSKEVEREEVDV